jgi:hypothetical protein
MEHAAITIIVVLAAATFALMIWAAYKVDGH